MSKIKKEISELNFQSLIEHVTELILVVDAERKIIFASPSVKSVLGYDANEIIGMNAVKFIHPDDLQKTKDDYLKLLSNPNKIQKVFLKMIKKDGSLVFIEGSRKNLLSDKNIEGIVLTFRDVTESTILDNNLKKAKDLLNATEQTSKIGGWEYDIPNKKMYWTEETYLIHEIPFDESKFGSIDLIEESIACYSNEDKEKVRTAFYNCVNNGVPYKLDCQFFTSNGKRLWVNTNGEAIVEDGKIIKVIGTISDITEKKQTELISKIRLELINFSFKHSLEELLQKTLDEAENLTNSEIGFIYLVEDDQVTVSLQAWSTNTLQYMHNKDKNGLHYGLDKVSMWVDCVQNKKTIIHNNYKSQKIKKGFTEVNSEIIRDVVVPIVRNNKIVAVIGFCNKKSDYDQVDVDLITTLTDFVWDIIEQKRLKQTLEENEVKYRMLFENASETISVVQDGKIILTNSNFTKLTGYTLEEVSKMVLINIIHPDDREMIIENTIQREKGEPHNKHYNFRLIRKDKTIRWVSRKFNEIMWEGRKAVLVVDNDVTDLKENEEKIKNLVKLERQKGNELEVKNLALQEAKISSLNILEDLSLENEERKQVEESLRLSKERYRTLAENSPIPVTVVSLNNGNLLYVNKKANEILGPAPEGKDYRNYFAKDFYCFPDQRNGFIKKIKKNGHVSNFEIELKSIENRQITALVSAVITIFLDEPAIFTSFYDITDRKKTEIALLESELRFQDVVAATGDWIWEIDKDGLYTYSSEASYDVIGYKPSEIVGKKYFFDFFQPEVKNRLKKIIFEQFALKKTFSNFDNVVVHKNNFEVYLSTSAKPLVDKAGNLLGYRGADKNITKRKQAEISLRESEEKFRSIVTNTEEILFMIDNNGIFTLSEGKGLLVLGLKPGQVVGQSAFEIYKDYPEIIVGINKALSGEKTVDKICVANEYMDIWYSPNMNEHGDIIGLIGMAINITEQVVAKQNLIESEEKFRNIFENHAAVKLLIDPEAGNILDANKSAARFYGWSIEELKKMRIFHLNTLHAEYVKLKMNEVVNSSQAHFNFKHRLANGSIRDVEVFSSMVNAAGKNIIHSIIHDITERKQIERELQKRSLAIEQSYASIVITDKEGNIEYVNPRFTQVTGYTFEEVLNNNPQVLKSGEQSNEFYKELWDTIIAGNNWSGIFHNKRKNGELFWESASISSLKDDNGNITNFVAIKEDITEKVEKDIELKNYRENLEQIVEERTTLLKESEETFRALAENSEDTIMRFDNKHRHLYVNPVVSEQTGINASEFIGKNHLELGFPKDLSEMWESAIEFVFKNKKKNRIEFMLPNKIWIDWTVLPEFDNNNNVNSVIAFGRDITERKATEVKVKLALEKEKDLNELKDQFMSTVSHDLRTPLTSIYSSVELIEAFYDDWEKEKVINKFGQIKNSVSRITDMLNHVLELSKIDKGKVRFKLNSVNLLNECERILEEVTTHKTENHELKLIYNPTDEYCKVDINLLREILINLLINALKYSPSGGKVILSVDRRNELLVLQVSDEGIGISEEDRQKIFNEFYRTDNSQNIAGSGLGLSIVKHYVEMYKGKIEVESELGSGSTFRVVLPESSNSKK